MMNQRLYKSNENKMVDGVCGGIAEYFGIDPISGELCISIGQKHQEPVYEGNNPELNHFQVNITNSGDYTISVTGKQAEGSISFHILRNEE